MNKQIHRQTVIKTDRQIHREKDNTLARKPIGSHYVGGIHCDTHTHTQLISFKNDYLTGIYCMCCMSEKTIILMTTTLQVVFLNEILLLI